MTVFELIEQIIDKKGSVKSHLRMSDGRLVQSIEIIDGDVYLADFTEEDNFGDDNG